MPPHDGCIKFHKVSIMYGKTVPRRKVQHIAATNSCCYAYAVPHVEHEASADAERHVLESMTILIVNYSRQTDIHT